MCELQIGNGSLPLNISKNQHYRVWGGPFKDVPNTMLGVKLDEHTPITGELELLIKDFSVPTQKDMQRLIREMVELIIQDLPLYVGCGWGQGRTGLVLACLAKAFDHPAPVAYVRWAYMAKAVETEQQKAFVEAFKPDWRTLLLLNTARIMAWFRGSGQLTKPQTRY